MLEFGGEGLVERAPLKLKKKVGRGPALKDDKGIFFA